MKENIETGAILDAIIKDRINENETLKRNTVEFYKILGIYNFVTVLLLKRLKTIKKESNEAFSAVLDTINITEHDREKLIVAVDLLPESINMKDICATTGVMDRILSPFTPIPYGELSEKFAENDVFREREMENIIGRLILAVEKRKK